MKNNMMKGEITYDSYVAVAGPKDRMADEAANRAERADFSSEAESDGSTRSTRARATMWTKRSVASGIMNISTGSVVESKL